VQLSTYNSLSAAFVFGASIKDYWPPKVAPPSMANGSSSECPIIISSFSTLAGALGDRREMVIVEDSCRAMSEFIRECINEELEEEDARLLIGFFE